MVVRYEFFVNLYEHEKMKSLRKCYKLTYSHIYPTNFERMNVRKAAQLLSRSVAIALNHYRNLPETATKFQGSFMKCFPKFNCLAF
jgi:hypothetical protein